MSQQLDSMFHSLLIRIGGYWATMWKDTSRGLFCPQTLIWDSPRSLRHCWCQNCDSKICCLQKCKAVTQSVPETLKPFNCSQARHSRNGVNQSSIWKYKFKLFGLVFFFNIFVAKLGQGLKRWGQVAYPQDVCRRTPSALAKHVHWDTTKPEKVPRPQLVLSLLLQGFGTTLLTDLLPLNSAR